MDASLPRDRADRGILAGLAARGVVVSRAELQRWMNDGHVRVDGATCTPAHKLPLGATVEVTPMPSRPSSLEPDASVRLEVVFEDDALIVLDKPAGLVVHPAKGHWEGTLVHGLLARPGFERAPAAGTGQEELERPGVVHRLDKGTSGLLVVAKTPSAREALKAQFAARTIDREYLAVLAGMARDTTIDAPHGRHPRDRLRFTSLGRPVAARRAVTHVRVLERFFGACLALCRLETGRTHQIRVQLAERLRTPILGDPLYGARPRDPFLARLADELGRQALHARLLGFEHPVTGARMRFESAPPVDLAKLIEALRARATKP